MRPRPTSAAVNGHNAQMVFDQCRGTGSRDVRSAEFYGVIVINLERQHDTGIRAAHSTFSRCSLFCVKAGPRERFVGPTG